jgi:hypothetical protein
LKGGGNLIWLEKSLSIRSGHRRIQEYAVGVALLSPEKANGSRDIYRSMRDVRKGDTILHLVDNKEVIGTSTAAASAKTVVFDSKTWYTVELENFRALDPCLPRDVFFSEPFRSRLIDLVQSRTSQLFYTKAGTLMQGAYLTQIPVAVMAVLEEAYKSFTGNTFPTE